MGKTNKQLQEDLKKEKNLVKKLQEENQRLYDVDLENVDLKKQIGFLKARNETLEKNKLIKSRYKNKEFNLDVELILFEHKQYTDFDVNKYIITLNDLEATRIQKDQVVTNILSATSKINQKNEQITKLNNTIDILIEREIELKNLIERINLECE